VITKYFRPRAYLATTSHVRTPSSEDETSRVASPTGAQIDVELNATLAGLRAQAQAAAASSA
jgi:hypothetical protein